MLIFCYGVNFSGGYFFIIWAKTLSIYHFFPWLCKLVCSTLAFLIITFIGFWNIYPCLQNGLHNTLYTASRNNIRNPQVQKNIAHTITKPCSLDFQSIKQKYLIFVDRVIWCDLVLFIYDTHANNSFIYQSCMQHIRLLLLH